MKDKIRERHLKQISKKLTKKQITDGDKKFVKDMGLPTKEQLKQLEKI